MLNKDTNTQTPSGFRLRHTLQRNRKSINRIAWSPDGLILAATSRDRTIQLWDTLTGKLLDRLKGIPTGEGNPYDLAWSPDGRMLASSASSSGIIRIWNVEARELYQTLPQECLRPMAWSPDGQIFVCGSDEFNLIFWDGQVTKQRGKLFDEETSEDEDLDDVQFICMAWSPDSQTLASAFGWSMVLANSEGDIFQVLEGHSHYISSLAWSPDGRILASTSEDKTIRLWNPETGQQVAILEGHVFTDQHDYATSVSFSPDGRFFASMSYKGKFQLWQCYDTGNLEPLFDVVDGNMGRWHTSPAFHPTNSVLATVQQAITFDDNDYVIGDPLLQIWDFEPSVLLKITPEIEELNSTIDNLNSDGYFSPESFEDARKRTTASIARRQGQPKFRSDLLKAYQGQCAVTGFNAEQALEAAHIYPYKGDDTNKVWNGLLLRADIHTLFDLYLITVHPETKEIRIAPELKGTSYSELDRKQLNLPKDENLCPRKEMLEWHYNKCAWV
jgi:WD40 repeat protein